jgi:hypothetical protein
MIVNRTAHGGPGSDLDLHQGARPAASERRDGVPLRKHDMGGGTMTRDTLIFRVSLIWLAILAVGFVCVFFML